MKARHGPRHGDRERTRVQPLERTRSGKDPREVALSPYPEVRRPGPRMRSPMKSAPGSVRREGSMRKGIGLGLVIASCALPVGACNDDDVVFLPAGDDGGAESASTGDGGGADASAFDGSLLDGSLSDAIASDGSGPDAAEGGTDADGGAWDGGADASDASSMSVDGDAAFGDADAEGGQATRLLLSYNGTKSSELVAFNVKSGEVAGRLEYPGFLGTTYVGDTNPWLLEQAVDLVAELNPTQPWLIRSSWNVALGDAVDGGSSYSESDGCRGRHRLESLRAPVHPQ